MSYRLDEIKDYLFDDEGNFNSDLEEDVYDELWEIFCSAYGSRETLEMPEFEHNGKVYPAKTFNFSKNGEEVMDDYCEGKTQYHYNIKLVDEDTGDRYQIFTHYFNDDMTGISLVRFEPKRVNGVIIEECCNNMKIVSVSAKCNDTFSYKEEKTTNWKEGSPSDLKLGNSDYVEFIFCKSCGKIHFK